MTQTLPRKDELDIVPTMFLRSQRPKDHSEFEKVLPWFTPLFVYEMDGRDWVRWSVPKAYADRVGISGGCSCCGEESTVNGDVGDIHVDTAWNETDWWLEANGYARPTDPESRTGSTEKESK